MKPTQPSVTRRRDPIADRIRVQLEGVSKGYGALHILRGASLTLYRGELIALYGPSGSGKTTLLNLVGGVDVPDSGAVRISGRDISRLSAQQRVSYRRQIGFIFQTDSLLPNYSAQENIDLALRLRDLGYRERRDRALYALEQVGLDEWADHLPAELSGGQRQRVAIARALAAQPPMILADEPTSGLDTQTSRRTLGLFRQMARERGTTFLIVSHDPLTAQYVDRIFDLADGQVHLRPQVTPPIDTPRHIHEVRP